MDIISDWSLQNLNNYTNLPVLSEPLGLTSTIYRIVTYTMTRNNTSYLFAITFSVVQLEAFEAFITLFSILTLHTTDHAILTSIAIFEKSWSAIITHLNRWIWDQTIINHIKMCLQNFLFWNLFLFLLLHLLMSCLDQWFVDARHYVFDLLTLSREQRDVTIFLLKGVRVLALTVRADRFREAEITVLETVQTRVALDIKMESGTTLQALPIHPTFVALLRTVHAVWVV